MNITPRAVLLSGARGSGKSTLCLRLAQELKCVGGIICPGIFDATGEKVGFTGLCLQSGESWELGRVTHDSEGAGPPAVRTAGGVSCGYRAPGGSRGNTHDEGRHRIGKYLLSEAGVQKSIDCIRASLERPGGITIIDEIGPLELEKGGGFAPVLGLLDGAGDLVIVVRAELFEAVAALVQHHDRRRFDLTVENREALRDDIASFLARSL